MKELGSTGFQGGLGKPTMALMWNTRKPLWLTGKTTMVESSLCVLK